MTPRPPRPTLFPYTTLFRSVNQVSRTYGENPIVPRGPRLKPLIDRVRHGIQAALGVPGYEPVLITGSGSTADRKSTRLNSSHLGISYAVFCLKKKKCNVVRAQNQASRCRPTANRTGAECRA